MDDCKQCYGFATDGLTLIDGELCECVPVLGSIADLCRRTAIVNNLKTRNEIKRVAKKYRAHKYMDPGPLPMFNIDICPDKDRGPTDEG